MADIVTLDVSRGVSDVDTPSAGAASFTVPLSGKDCNAVLVVNNRNAAKAIKASVAAGDGIMSVLGALDVNIAAASIGAIPLADSERFKVYTTGKCTVALTDTAGSTLTAGELAAIDIALVQR